MKQLFTRWGKAIDTEHCKEEYPRPRLKRDSYVNLNERWQYAIRQEKGENRESPSLSQMDGDIFVPFSPESVLSGVNHILQPEETLYYRKKFTLPENWKDSRVLLHFGAVDQECRVWCDGQYLGSHTGGYLPFTMELTGILEQNTGQQWHELTLAVTDATEQSPHARGKQKLVRKGHMASIFYTPQSGIWKTVWMEAVPEQFIENVHIRSDIHTGEVKVEVVVNQPAGKKAETQESTVQIFYKGEELVQSPLFPDTEGQLTTKLVIPQKQRHLWTTDTPNLYDVEIFYGEDQVTSYFALRQFGRAKDEKGIWRFTLNDKPFFFNGVLDQGYFPDGLLTAPSDAALLFDIRRLKELGFNTIRKHIKIEEERFYYHCDRLGMAVWQDMPNGGGAMNHFFVTDLPNAFPVFGRKVKDNHYRLFQRTDEEGREQFYRDLTGMVELLRDYPCIALWTPFNEGWGQFDAAKATALIRKLDDTRLVNEACGWFDQGGGDVYSIHNYLRALKLKSQPDRVVALTEFGGYACPTPGHMACEKEFGYKGYQNKQQLTEAYRALWQRDVLPWIEKGLSAAIYTQTSDIEEEINGFFTYDREEEKLEAAVVQEVNRKISQEYEGIHICVKEP